MTPTDDCTLHPQDLDTQLKMIYDGMIAAQNHLKRLRQTMARLQQEGMYDAVPTESWQDRGGAGQYLYHYFPMDRLGSGYLGPDGKKKHYVGSDPARIAEARRLADNRRRYEDLAAAADRLEQWLTWRRQDLATLTGHAIAWPRFDFRTL
jgi:hypothetical protein